MNILKYSRIASVTGCPGVIAGGDFNDSGRISAEYAFLSHRDVNRNNSIKRHNQFIMWFNI